MGGTFPFLFVTGNDGKRQEAERLLGRPVETVEVDLPEIQSLDLREVLEAKADEAWRRVGRPMVVEETGLELVVMGGFPGPLVKWMLAAVGPEGIARCGLALGDARVAARCALLCLDGEQRYYGEGVTRGLLVAPGRGPHGFGWDPVFLPEGETRTYGELAPLEKDRTGHRGRAWRDLLTVLATHGIVTPTGPGAPV